MKTQRGITLIEVMVTVAIVAILVAMAMPSIGEAGVNSRARTVVSKFIQDFAAVRSMASGNAKDKVQMILRDDCSWTAMLNDAELPAYSYTKEDLDKNAPGLVCVTMDADDVAQVFDFRTDGSTTSSAFRFEASTGQAWPVRVLTSGAVMRVGGAS